MRHYHADAHSGPPSGARVLQQEGAAFLQHGGRLAQRARRLRAAVSVARRRAPLRGIHDLHVLPAQLAGGVGTALRLQPRHEDPVPRAPSPRTHHLGVHALVRTRLHGSRLRAGFARAPRLSRRDALRHSDPSLHRSLRARLGSHPVLRGSGRQARAADRRRAFVPGRRCGGSARGGQRARQRLARRGATPPPSSSASLSHAAPGGAAGLAQVDGSLRARLRCSAGALATVLAADSSQCFRSRSTSSNASRTAI